MNVLSLFDGMSCGQIALNRIGKTPTKYYAAEIDKYAIKVTQANYPDTIQLGSVLDWQSWDIDWSSIDLVTGGFPCQAWSVAGKQQGDKDERGMLFWTMLDIMKTVMLHNPNAYFLIENVKMKKDFEQYITYHTEQALGVVHKHLINSALVSAQNRNRYYWTNIEGITHPEDKGLVLCDVLEDGVNDKQKSQTILSTIYKENAKSMVQRNKMGLVVCGELRSRYIVDGKRQDHKHLTDGLTEQRLEIREDGKTNTLTTVQKDNVVVIREKSKTVRSGGLGSYDRHEWDSISDCHYRKLTPLECERLQTVPDNYTNHVSNTQRYKMIGNGWTVDVIAHILRFVKWATH
jgi:DNA-cytosine methyltransferase